MDKLQKFFPLVKVDIPQRLVYGLVTAERVDKDNETCHYETTKAEYQAVNEELGKASDGQNIMPLREMHQLNAVGAGKSITFDDSNKQILMSFKVVDDSTWNKVLEKVLLGFSQGGRYIKKWSEAGKNFYTAQPGEVSLVDNPCLPGAYIEYAKADGGVEFYRTPGQMSDEDVSRVSKAVISELGTELEKIRALFPNSDHSSAVTGDAMKPEDIKKCATALGITEAEFTKQFIEGGLVLAKKHSMAALHAHLEKALAHHAAHHEAMTKAHEAHSAHLEKAMAMCKGLMGSDEKDAEKALKAILDELTPEKKKEETPETITKADAEKMVNAAVTAALKKIDDDKLAKDDTSRVRLFVERGGKIEKLDTMPGRDPIPV